MALMWWLAIGWCGCAIALVIFERIRARYTTGFVDPTQPRQYFAIYATLLIFSPIVLPAALIINAQKAWQWIPWLLSFGRGEDPYSRFDQDWPTDRDLFLGMLIRRRKLFDPRLRREVIDNWLMRDFWSMPEAIVLEAVDAYRDLKSGNAQDWQIWEKLDTWLNVDGPPMPDGAAISYYLQSRMQSKDPNFLRLGERVLSGHIDICNRWLNKAKSASSTEWPPLEWLTKKLTFAEFESMSVGAQRAYADAPAVLHLSRSEQDLFRMKLRLLAGDEVWAFSSSIESWRMLGGRAGIALVRDGHVVAHVVSKMN